jgi:hypothetical protein
MKSGSRTKAVLSDFFLGTTNMGGEGVFIKGVNRVIFGKGHPKNSPEKGRTRSFRKNG